MIGGYVPTESKLEKYDQIHAALLGNGLNNDVANFLAALAMRVNDIEERERENERQ